MGARDPVRERTGKLLVEGPGDEQCNEPDDEREYFAREPAHDSDERG